jgi:hypothetical protein
MMAWSHYNNVVLMLQGMSFISLICIKYWLYSPFFKFCFRGCVKVFFFTVMYNHGQVTVTLNHFCFTMSLTTSSLPLVLYLVYITVVSSDNNLGWRNKVFIQIGNTSKFCLTLITCLIYEDWWYTPHHSGLGILIFYTS